MTRTASAPHTPQVSHPGHACPPAFPGRGGRLAAAVTTALLLILGGTARSSGAEGLGIGIKVGAQTLQDPVSLDHTTRPRVELELASPMLWDEHVDFALGLGGSYLGSYTDTYTDTVDGIFRDDLYKDRLWLFDIRLAARLYPLGNSSSLRPYLGAGVGYFWFRDDWENEYSDTDVDPLSPTYGDTIYDHAEGNATLASGFFSFLLAGVTVPLGEHLELLGEIQYDFAKQDEGFDFDGPIYTLGARWRF